MLMAIVLILTQCHGYSVVEPVETPCEENISCKTVFVLIPLQLKYNDGQLVLLDSSTVFWVSQNRFLDQDSVLWNLAARTWGYYYIVDDDMQKELENKEEIMRFTGYLNGEIVCERNLLVGADCCHVKYLGTEPLIQIIQRASDDEPDNPDGSEEDFCLYLNSGNMDETLPIINEFLTGLPDESTEKQKLDALIDWLETFSCVREASIFCVSCVKTSPLQSEISISVNINNKTEDFILDILMSNPLKATRYHEHY